jgi:hypothetical protein
MTTAVTPAGSIPYPVHFDVRYPDKLSRLLIFVKWLLAIPHLIVLYFLYAVAGLIWLIAFFMILFTRKYPDGMFKFSEGVFRWYANVTAYLLLMRDEYPPFTLDASTYPVTFDVEYPETLNRWLPLVKWLLIIPHYLVLIFLGLAAYAVTFVAWFAILFTGSYPKAMFDFNVGVLRWAQRVNAYHCLMRDEYPPFSLS